MLPFVQALQNGDANSTSQFIKVAAVPKHFVAYSLEEADGEMRFYFDAKVTDQDLQDTYLATFKAAVIDGGVRGLMCSYNQVNGEQRSSGSITVECI